MSEPKVRPNCERYHGALNDLATSIFLSHTTEAKADVDGSKHPGFHEALKLLALRPDLPTDLNLLEIIRERGLEVL